ncbi:MAG: MerR family transcriptional regulator [Christensenellales bacterium]
MKFTVSELARQSGVSVRTLHYYDEIGLLHPVYVSETGYRYYDGASLSTLLEILFFKEIGFSLKEIAALLADPAYQKKEALKDHLTMLQLKKKHIESIIDLADKAQKGELEMEKQTDYYAAYEAAQKKYADEARRKWGNTGAYKQSEERSRRYGKNEWAVILKESGEIMKGFAGHKGEPAGSPALQEFAKKWQDYISRYFYDCTFDILSGLTEMYVADERFTKSIDRYGAGTAQCMREALFYYCEKYKNQQ